MKLVPYHGVLLKEYVGEILKSFDKFQVVPSSMKVFPTNFNGHLSPMVSRPSEGRADRDTVGTGYPVSKPNTAKHVVSDGPEYRAEIKGINSSKLQSDILLHKRIHIYGQYSF